MRKGFLTAFFMFTTAFALLFLFQKNKAGIQKADSTNNLVSPRENKISAQKSLTAPKLQAESSAAQTQENGIKNHSEPEMNETLAAFFNEMPRTNRLQTVTAAELHGTPQVVLEAGEKLADIHEYFSSHPQSRDIEMSFYLKCSQQKDFFDSIRAVCAARLSRHYFEATGHQISSEIFDENIDQLRREINL